MNADIRASAPQQPPQGRLERSLVSGRFTVTAEVVPPRGASLNRLRRIARLLRPWIAAANVTDGQSAQTRMSSWAGCYGLMQEDVEPVMQLQCRDRNRIALQADLLGAAAIGIPNMLCLTGDHQRYGDQPEAKGVFDLDSIQLTWLARTMRDEQRLLSGRRLATAPRWFIGAVENPFAAPQRFRAERMGKKVAAGAQFLQTQFVFDVDILARWMEQVRDLGLHERCYILPTVGAIRSLRVLELMHSLPGLYIPEHVDRRLRGVSEERLPEEGLDVCVETIQHLREIPGIAGVHISPAGWEDYVPELMARAGLQPYDHDDLLEGSAASEQARTPVHIASGG